jgi:hypothetical protein
MVVMTILFQQFFVQPLFTLHLQRQLILLRSNKAFIKFELFFNISEQQLPITNKKNLPTGRFFSLLNFKCRSLKYFHFTTLIKSPELNCFTTFRNFNHNINVVNKLVCTSCFTCLIYLMNINKTFANIFVF